MINSLFIGRRLGLLRLLRGGDDVTGLEPRRRNLGYLPQDFGVYPNLDAVEFLRYLAALKGLTQARARSRVSARCHDISTRHDDRSTTVPCFAADKSNPEAPASRIVPSDRFTKFTPTFGFKTKAVSDNKAVSPAYGTKREKGLALSANSSLNTPIYLALFV